MWNDMVIFLFVWSGIRYCWFSHLGVYCDSPTGILCLQLMFLSHLGVQCNNPIWYAGSQPIALGFGCPWLVRFARCIVFDFRLFLIIDVDLAGRCEMVGSVWLICAFPSSWSVTFLEEGENFDLRLELHYSTCCCFFLRLELHYSTCCC
jgi:hypothetical protein